MNIVLLQQRLSDDEVKQLIQEFPQYLFLAPREATYKNLGKEEWNRVEILYGNRLTKEELPLAHQLRWIHCPVPNLNPLCLNDIVKMGTIILTGTKEENAPQIAEYVLSCVLAYAKNLFHWNTADKNPVTLWDSKWRETMWTLKDKVFLQVGLGNVGTEIARLAMNMDMKVWGLREQRSFHPYCHKTFSYQEMHSILPAVDVICVAFQRGKQKEKLIGKMELELMKDDTILVVVGSKATLNEEDIAEVSRATGKFRGIVLDAYYQIPVSATSKLWSVPNTLITPEVAPRPKSSSKESYRLFRYNLRQYLHGNFNDMRFLFNTKEMTFL